MLSLRDSNKLLPEPVASLRGLSPYVPVQRDEPNTLYLDANEGGEVVGPYNRYPSTIKLQRSLAASFGFSEDRIFVGAGGDDVIERILRSYLDVTRQLTIATPTFEMIPQFAALTGAQVVRVPWGERYPADEILKRSKVDGVIAIVSPNNPTGAVVPLEAVQRIANARPNAVILLDLAYVEFADEDPTDAVQSLSNVICVRTFSKAFGLASARVGYAIGDPRLLAPLKIVGSPYPVSTTSSELAIDALRNIFEVDAAAKRARKAVERLATQLDSFGIETKPSQANFVYAKGEKALQLERALSAQQIRCRRFDDAIRLSVPSEPDAIERLRLAIDQTFDPDAILFDMDGVLVDVRKSYRQAIIETCAVFGVDISHEEIDIAKQGGDANDDWQLTQRLLLARGISASLLDVTAAFEQRYQGGLWQNETALLSRDQFPTDKPLAVVTGRPRRDAQRAIRQFGWEDVFEAVICREDAPLKPSPDPVKLAQQTLGAKTAWFFGDTIDDLVAGRRAGVLPVGVGVESPFSFSTTQEGLSWL